MTIDPTALGFILPADQDWISEGDDAITQNARVAAELIVGKADQADVDQMWSRLFFRGSPPANANFDDYYTDAHSGLWSWSLSGSATLTGLPPGWENRAGSMLVLGAASRIATQMYIPYGFYGGGILTRSIKDIGTREWTEWAALGGGGSTPSEGEPFVRGTVPAGSDLSLWTTSEWAGLWHFTAGTAATLTGLPSGMEDRAGSILVLATDARLSTHFYLPYGWFSTEILTRTINNIGTHEWTTWAPIGGAGADIRPVVQNTIRKTQFLYAMGGPIDTQGRGAVSLRCDHGLTNFASKVLPVTSAMGMKVSQAYNPRNWGYPENEGVTAADLNGWVAAGDVEIWNHSASHQGAEDEAALYDQIVNGLAEIEAELPAARGKVWGFAPPGVTVGDYMGFGNGATPDRWDGPAGRLILKHHAIGSAYMAGTAQRILDGVPRDAESHYGLDSSTVANAKAQIDQAIANKTGLQLFLHPSQLDVTGKITTAQFEEVMAYIAQKRDEGVLAVMSPYEMAVADSTRTHTPHDSGDLDITASLTGVESGNLILTRIGQDVWANFQDLKLTAPGTNVTWNGAVPVGYQPPSAFIDLPLQGRTTADTAGPVRVAGNGQIAVYKPSGTIRGLVSWFTRQAPPV